LADAIDLDTALAHIAAELKDLGNTLPLDQRRALAAGELARRQFTMTYEWDTHSPDQITPTVVEEKSARWSSAGEERAGVSRPDPTTTTTARPHPRRDITLYAHLSADAIHTMTGCGAVDPEAVVRLEGHGGQLITLDTLRDWLHAPFPAAAGKEQRGRSSSRAHAPAGATGVPRSINTTQLNNPAEQFR